MFSLQLRSNRVKRIKEKKLKPQKRSDVSGGGFGKWALKKKEIKRKEKSLRKSVEMKM